MIKIIHADLNNKQHATTLVELLNKYALDPMGGGKELSSYSKSKLANTLAQRNDCIVLFALIKQQPVGLLTAFEGFSTFNCKPLLNIHDVVVLKDYRGKKVSTALFKEIENIAKQREYCKLTLEVLEGNLAAKKAYEKFGFSGYELDPTMGKALFWEKKI